MQSFAPIKVGVLGGVDEVETCDPADHACSENQWRQVEPASFGYPRARRRNSERQAEKEMGRACEAFRDRVKENNGEGYRRQPCGQAIDRGGGEEETNRRDHEQKPPDWFAQQEMSRRRPRIFFIDRPIDQTIE